MENESTKGVQIKNIDVEIRNLKTEAKAFVKTYGSSFQEIDFQNFVANRNWQEDRITKFRGFLTEELRKLDNKKSEQSELLHLIPSNVKYFYDQYNDACALIELEDHNETWPISSQTFKRYLIKWLVEAEKIPSSETVATLKNLSEAHALQSNICYPLYNRVAEQSGAVYIDMADKEWHAIRISKDGAQVINKVPPIFRRYSHQLPIEIDLKGQREDYQKYLNIFNFEHQRTLVEVYVGCLFIPSIPKPILIPHGHYGAAKSTFCKNIRALIDPSQLPLLAMKNDEKELPQLLNHHYCPFFDNVSELPQKTSDMLCRACTGEGITKRTLFTDDDDRIYQYRRGVALNGINVPSTAPDLIDRALMVELKRIPEAKRLTEKEVEAILGPLRAKAIGYICKTLADAMKIVDEIEKEITERPRMADFAIFGESLARSMGYEKNIFLSSYLKLAKENAAIAVREHMLAGILLKFSETDKGVELPFADFYTRLRLMAEQDRLDTRSYEWPKSATAMGRKLNTLAPALEEIGLKISFRNGTDNIKFVRVEKIDNLTTLQGNTTLKPFIKNEELI